MYGNFVQLSYFFWIVILLLTLPLSSLLIKPKPLAANPQQTAEPQPSQSFGKEYIAGINFYGGAKPQSRIDEESLVLVAVDEAKWAYAQIDFRQQVDLWGNSITFLTKGGTGKEILKIALIDINRRTTGANGHCIKLTTDWQKVTIDAEEIKTANIDKGKVGHIKFIIDSVSRKKESGGTIYIKDFAIRKDSHEEIDY